jgi:hypothetical protein
MNCPAVHRTQACDALLCYIMNLEIMRTRASLTKLALADLKISLFSLNGVRLIHQLNDISRG